MEGTPSIDNIEPDDTTPSIFINKTRLNLPTVSCNESKNIFSKVYEVLGETFLDEYNPNCAVFKSWNDELVEFTLEEVNSETNVDDDEELINHRKLGTGDAPIKRSETNNASDKPSAVLAKYIKNIDKGNHCILNTATGAANIKRSVIRLTSNNSSEVKSRDIIKNNDDQIHRVPKSEINGEHTSNLIKKHESHAQSQRTKDTRDNKAKNNGNLDDYIQIVIKKTHFVIDIFAFNTMVFYGDAKYCFLCKVMVANDKVWGHINKNSHRENMLKHSLLENYSKHLIRQNSYKYHCGICNVVVNHTHLTTHIEWATHQKLSILCKTKKSLRKSAKAISVATQREERLSTVNAPKIKILCHVEILATPETPAIDIIRNKIVNVNGSTLCINFYNWNGLCKLENGFRCLICEQNLTENIEMHCEDRHCDGIMYNIDGKYFPALIRELNDKYVHCLSCNKLLFNDDGVISTHITVKKHMKNHSKLISK